MNTKQNESRIQNDLWDCEALVFLKKKCIYFLFLYCPFSGLRVKGTELLLWLPGKGFKKKKKSQQILGGAKPNRWLHEPVELPVESPVESATLDVSLLAGKECRKCRSQTAR